MLLVLPKGRGVVCKNGGFGTESVLCVAAAPTYGSAVVSGVLKIIAVVRQIGVH